MDAPHTYPPRALREKWQKYWDENQTFRTANPGEADFDASRPKAYILDFFPYPSGSGLHVGHPEGYTATDILARYRRMRGYNVLHTMGWDAFGLPAEQHAIETGEHPAVTTNRNIDTFRRQLKMLGFSYDWRRELSTTDTGYYKWTQWIFLRIFNSWYDAEKKKARPIAELPIPADVKSRGEKAVRAYVDGQRLAFIAEVPVNWCPALGTVLANEEVTNEGRSERGNHPVFKRPLKQWMLRITKYGDRLIEDLEELDWPESVKIMQRNWIGRSEGAQVRFRIDGRDDVLEIYTTRPDTLFGATYMVLAPEHPFVTKITAADRRAEVEGYCREAANRTELDRTADAKKKTGVFTGAYAINPVFPAGDARGRIPIWVADYVMMSYGTGAIMAVPGQDQRDWDFAKAFNLPIIRTVQPPADFDGEAYLGEGVAINSEFLNGLEVDAAKQKIIAWLEEKGVGVRAINYKLRDWLFSRQRYWGEPIPILHGPDGELMPLDESELPLTLPEMEDFRPTTREGNDASTPEPPLGRAKEWATVTRDGKTYKRELNTMPQWAGSCWYYLRFCEPWNEARFVGAEAERYWMLSKRKDGKPHVGGIDLYLGGAEHAVLHLLYARFWHKVLYDLGEVSTVEPFGKLFNQGMIRAFSYRDSRGIPVGYDEIDFREEGAIRKTDGEKLVGTVEKMSKSLKNVINPEEVVDEYGADSLRLYEMFMGPLEASKPWNPRDVPGVFRFLQRSWRLIVDENTGALAATVIGDKPLASFDALERTLHKTIQKTTQDLDRMAFNTAISAMMEFVNEAYRAKGLHKSQAERFVMLLSVFAPHIGEELWQRLRGKEWRGSMSKEPWPTWDDNYVVENEVEIPVQINGKVVAKILIARDADEPTVKSVALANDKVKDRIGAGQIAKCIFVPGRMLNLVVK
ncbi:MAG: leucine--tRNA ligase [Planctomycetia bacterium]|nr:leucine--tRNA ligase [Planctomycetia bacterium]MCC7315320.1 leucine--tRNA ligase [Planctomycetota bacterium]